MPLIDWGTANSLKTFHLLKKSISFQNENIIKYDYFCNLLRTILVRVRLPMWIPSGEPMGAPGDSDSPFIPSPRRFVSHSSTHPQDVWKIEFCHVIFTVRHQQQIIISSVLPSSFISAKDPGNFLTFWPKMLTTCTGFWGCQNPLGLPVGSPMGIHIDKCINVNGIGYQLMP